MEGPETAAPPVPALPPLPSLTNTFGAVLISSFIAVGLYGVTINQTFQYYRSYPSDVAVLKLLVLVMFVADTFHTVTLVHISYHYLVSNFFDPLNLLLGEWSIQVMSISTGAVVICAQSFYARRIYLVNRRYKLVVFAVGALIVVELGFMIVATYHAIDSRTFFDFAPYLWMDSVLFCLVTVTDLVLLVVFVIFLRTSRTAFRGTQVTLDSLALYAVIATFLNTALTIPAFITSLTSRDTFIYMAMAIPTTKIYSNSVLAFLNCRSGLKEAMLSGGSQSFSLSRLKRGNHGASQSRSRSDNATQRSELQLTGAVVIDIKAPDIADDTASGVDLTCQNGEPGPSKRPHLSYYDGRNSDV